MSGIPSWAKVGARVVCIKRGPWQIVEPGNEMDLVEPTYGEVCTITGIVFGRHAVLLTLLGYNDGYAVYRFRPVKTIEDDITEHFAHHLTTPARLERV